MTTELKPCPFCGGTPSLDDYRDKPAASWVLVHRGRGCLISPQVLNFPTAEAAAQMWNTRASAPPVGDVREKVERVVMAAVSRARASEVDPVRSHNINWRLNERDQAVTEATDAILALLSQPGEEAQR